MCFLAADTVATVWGDLLTLLIKARMKVNVASYNPQLLTKGMIWSVSVNIALIGNEAAKQSAIADTIVGTRYINS